MTLKVMLTFLGLKNLNQKLLRVELKIMLYFILRNENFAKNEYKITRSQIFLYARDEKLIFKNQSQFSSRCSSMSHPFPRRQQVLTSLFLVHFSPARASFFGDLGHAFLRIGLEHFQEILDEAIHVGATFTLLLKTLAFFALAAFPHMSHCFEKFLKFNDRKICEQTKSNAFVKNFTLRLENWKILF